MKDQVKFDKVNSVLLAFAVAVMIFLPKLIAIPMVLLLVWTINGILQKNVKFQFNWILGLFICFYLAYLVGMLFSEDLVLGKKYLEYKLSFVILPFIFMWKTKGAIDKKWIAIAYIGSMVALFVMGVLNGFEQLGKLSTFNSFTSTRFSNVHHPTYLSVFALFGLELIRSNFIELRDKRSLKYVLVALFLLIQLLCVSLAGYLFLFIYLCVLFMIYLRRRFGRRMVIGLSTLTFLSLIAVSSLVSPVRLQFETAFDSFMLYSKDPQGFVRSRQTYVTGNETRLIVWTAAYYEIIDHPLGVGTGNVDIHLEQRLRDLKQSEDFISRKYNPHNQFLQTWLEIGFVGFGILIMIISLTIRAGLLRRHGLLILLGSSLFFQSLFESMLQRQSGIVFYTFWICLFVVYFEAMNYKRAES